MTSRWVKRAAIAVLAVVVVLFGAGAWYVNDYYRADDVASAVMADADGDANGVVVRELSGGAVAFVPGEPVAGLVFYPGAKVQPEAYAPLMEQCAERGVLCVLVRPLFNLALLDVNAANGVMEQFPDVDTWMVGGHSMGGVAGASFAAQHAGAFDALVFLASYPNDDLSGFDGEVLSLYGSNDEVLNRDKRAAAFSQLPSDARDEEIAGGNHGQFGNYGEQAGDGTATITREEQQAQTADAIAELAQERRAMR